MKFTFTQRFYLAGLKFNWAATDATRAIEGLKKAIQVLSLSNNLKGDE